MKKIAKLIFTLILPAKEWKEVIDFTKVKKGGVGIKEVLARL